MDKQNEFKDVVKVKHFNKAWQKVLLALSCIVVFCVTYALILPAITLDTDNTYDYICGYVEHEHDESCFAEDGKTLICNLPVHHHTFKCIRLSGTVKNIGRAVMRSSSNQGGSQKSFEGWINGATVKVKDHNGAWVDLPSDGSVSATDTLQFNLTYSVPGNQLSQTCKMIYYDIPNVNFVTADSGRVKNSAGEEVGDYVISGNGHIEITFDDSATNNIVAMNASGTPVMGYINFECDVSDMTSSDGDEIHFDFNGHTVTVKPGQEQHGDGSISVAKTANVTDNKNGFVDFQIVVQSQNGTSTPPVVTDDLTGRLIYWDSLVVRDSSGNDVTSSCQITGENANTPLAQGAGKFDVTLPHALHQGESYTITYRAKHDEMINGTITEDNVAIVNSTDTENRPIDDRSTARVVFTNKILSKSGALSSDEQSVTWTVLINESKNDISGCILNDDDATRFHATNITLTDSSGNSQAVTLPYTFPSHSTDSYTLTYVTPFYAELAEGNELKMTNTATLLPNGGDVPSETPATGVVGKNGTPALSKTAGGFNVNGNTALTNWTVRIDASESAISAPWVYDDTLSQNMELTPSQQTALRDELNEAFGEYFSPNDFVINIASDHFVVTVNRDLPIGSVILFNYVATGNIHDVESPETFSNTGSLTSKNKTISSTPDITYHPMLHKRDVKATHDDKVTSHEYYELDGKLSWDIQVEMLGGVSGILGVIDHLPPGVHFESMYLQIEGETDDDGKPKKHPFVLDNDTDHYFADPHSGTSLSGEHVIEAYLDGSDIVIDITHKTVMHANEKLFNFYVTCTLDNPPQDQTIDTYHNTVELINSGNKIAEDDQTQRVSINIYKKALDKYSPLDNTSTEHDKTDNKGETYHYTESVPYTLKVNPSGDDLVPGSDTLKIVDKLSFYDEPTAPTDVSLMQNSVHVYHMNANGSKGNELSSGEFGYTYSSARVGQGLHTIEKTLEITVPDGEPLLVEYEYYARSNQIDHLMTLTNKVSITGVSDSAVQKQHGIKIAVKKSAAGADAKNIVLYKCDSNDFKHPLAGAKFSLFKWDSASSAYVLIDANLVTDQRGIAIASNMEYNTTYKLVETQAPLDTDQNPPVRYNCDSTPYYFYIKDPDLSHTVTHFDPSQTANEYLEGGMIFRPNIADTTDIMVKKQWKDQDQNDITATTDGQITFELWRKNTENATVQTNVPLIFDLHGKWGVGTVISHEFSFLSGSEVTFSIRYTPYRRDKNSANPPPPAITVTGVTLPEPAVTRVDGDVYIDYVDYTYTFTIENPVSITGNLDPISEWHITEDDVNCTGAPQGSGDAVALPDSMVGVYTVHSTNSWQYLIRHLPLVGTNEENGNPVTFEYYVREVEGLGPGTVYVNNDGITEGEITIINISQRTPGYILPETGGIGVYIFYILGSMLILAALVFLLYNFFKRKDNDDK